MSNDNEDGKIPPFAVRFRRRKGRPPAEQEFLDSTDHIPEDILKMTNEEVDTYLKEHGLEYLVTPERVDALLALAKGDTHKAAAKLVVVWDRDKGKSGDQE